MSGIKDLKRALLEQVKSFGVEVNEADFDMAIAAELDLFGISEKSVASSERSVDDIVSELLAKMGLPKQDVVVIRLAK